MGGSALKQLKSAMHPFFKAVIFLPNSKARIYGDARQVSLSSLIVSVKRFNDFCLQSITVSLLPSASGSGGGVGGPFDTSQSF